MKADKLFGIDSELSRFCHSKYFFRFLILRIILVNTMLNILITIQYSYAIIADIIVLKFSFRLRTMQLREG